MRIFALPVLLSLVPMVSFFEKPCLGCRGEGNFSLRWLRRIFIMFWRFLGRVDIMEDSEAVSTSLDLVEYWNNDPTDWSLSSGPPSSKWEGFRRLE